MFDYQSVSQIIEAAMVQNVRIADVVLTDQSAAIEISKQEIISQFKEILSVMRRSAEHGLQKDIKSVSGLTGGDGYLMHKYAQSGQSLSGRFCAIASAYAIGIQEYNAAMGKIVAAPTAGACGILPACVLTMMEQKNIEEDAAISALITAGAVGMVIATNASISGAAGGCQAECGSAAAMSAAALVEMSGGSPQQCGHAAALALSNLLGLVCDPVAGLVEVPCIMRNSGCVVVAINAADLALAGIQSHIPVDEVIKAMGDIGYSMPESLRETATGGLAATPTGIKIKKQIFGEKINE